MALTILILGFGTIALLVVISSVSTLLIPELLRLRGVTAEETYGALYCQTFSTFAKTFGLFWLAGVGIWALFAATPLSNFLHI